jgi:Xaa-Pro aminopeptidase
MPSLIKSAHSIYINTTDQEKPDAVIFNQAQRKAAEFKKMYPSHKILGAESILREIVMVKHRVETELLKKAVKVTGMAFDRVLRHVHPGMKEYEVEAELTYVLSQNGCHHAFEPIVASGKSACTLHYTRNDKTIYPGSLILIDFGAEYANMASDMTRTIPVSGKFTIEQRKIYNAVLFVLREVTQMMQPGVTFKELNKETGQLIESELIKLKILSKSEIKKQDSSQPLWKKYFMHGVSHHLGYDVHDTAERDTPFQEGMILTCEPGIYLPERKIGIRIENDILITRKGPQNLMSSIPVEAEEIESIMQTKTY